MTSGFTSVTNDFIIDILSDTLSFLKDRKIQMTEYSDFFEKGYMNKWNKDVFHYLDAIANNDVIEQKRGMSHRVIRALIEIHAINGRENLKNCIDNVLSKLNTYYDGQKNSKEIQKLKGMIREYEEELFLANF